MIKQNRSCLLCRDLCSKPYNIQTLEEKKQLGWGTESVDLSWGDDEFRRSLLLIQSSLKSTGVFHFSLFSLSFFFFWFLACVIYNLPFQACSYFCLWRKSIRLEDRTWLFRNLWKSLYILSNWLTACRILWSRAVICQSLLNAEGKKNARKKQNTNTGLTFKIFLNSREFEWVFEPPHVNKNPLLLKTTRDHSVCHIISFQGILNHLIWLETALFRQAAVVWVQKHNYNIGM